MNNGGEIIRVYIGTEQKTEIARKVLEFSIRRRTECEVRFTPMLGKAWEYPKDLPVGTGFSLRRWMIAAHCEWQGLALYLDADQLVLGDIGDLVRIMQRTAGQPVIWCTRQPDKFSATRPTPQTSVMGIDCAQAKFWWGFSIDKIITHLRAHPDREHYARFMHADWIPAERVASLPTEWNHLNVYESGERRVAGQIVPATRLLHYTCEPEQPWYRPDHPLAGLWQRELTAAIASGAVTTQEIEEALERWGQKEDWRNTNGLHPDYARFISLSQKRPHVTKPDLRARPPRPAAPATPTEPAHRESARILWVTSFDRAIFDASGRALVTSFLRTESDGTLLCCTEGAIDLAAEFPDAALPTHRIDKDKFLTDWLKQNAGVIPKHLGGLHDGKCRCRGGPFAMHDKHHRQPCLAYWFNRNASRWFRKVASLHHAVEKAIADGFTLLVWVDADCVFTAKASVRVVEGWFHMSTTKHPQLTGVTNLKHGVGVFYLKSKRQVLESGVIGFNLAAETGGCAVLDAVFERYVSRRFRQDERWDDCYQFQKAISAAKGLKAADLATGVGKEHADVVPYSAVGPYITHRKGLHSRGLGIMT